MKASILTLLAILCLAFSPGASAQDYVPTPVTVSKEKVKLGGKVYLSHVVLERQTLFGIAKAYHVGVDDLYEANPSLRETGLQKNAIILIPLVEGAGQPVIEGPAAVGPEQQPAYKEHTVKWFEDIDDIARRYGVSVKDIMEFNGLKSRKVSKRQVLRIPLQPLERTAEASAQEMSTPEETVETAPAEEPGDDGKKSFFENLFERFTGKNNVSMALVMPLGASGRVSEVNMDFYSGVLLALRDLQQEGINTEINVYDLAAGLPTQEQLTRNDFVLGPVATRDLEAVLERVDGKVPVISPLDQKAATLLPLHSNFIQVPGAADSQYEGLAGWITAENRSGDRILFVTEKAAKSTAASVGIRNALMRAGLSYDILSYAIVEGRGIPATLTAKMTKDGTNRVIVASESEAFIGDVMRNLGIMLGKGYDIVMYAPSKVRTFDTIDGSAYHQNRLHIATSYYVDYDDPRVKDFVLAYRALYRTEPSQFAFQGYDTARYFAGISARYGNYWLRALERTESKGLHTDFRFTREEGGAHQNTAVRRIVYNKDYTTEMVK